MRVESFYGGCALKGVESYFRRGSMSAPIKLRPITKHEGNALLRRSPEPIARHRVAVILGAATHMTVPDIALKKFALSGRYFKDHDGQNAAIFNYLTYRAALKKIIPS